MISRSQLTIVAIFGLSLLAAVSSLWFRYRQTRPVLEFWGPVAARLITHAERVEALQLELHESGVMPDDSSQQLEVDGKVYRVIKVRDVTKGRGMTNLRHALTLRKSFRWDPDPAACRPDWQYGLRFSAADQQVTVLFSFDCQLTRLVTRDRVAGIEPIGQGLEIVLREQLEQPVGETPVTVPAKPTANEAERTRK